MPYLIYREALPSLAGHFITITSAPVITNNSSLRAVVFHLTVTFKDRFQYYRNGFFALPLVWCVDAHTATDAQRPFGIPLCGTFGNHEKSMIFTLPSAPWVTFNGMNNARAASLSAPPGQALNRILRMATAANKQI